MLIEKEHGFTDCPRCSQRLRIAPERMPSADDTIGLVCPRCREHWRWSPAGHAAVRELVFRCAYSGKHFSVLYAKEDRDWKFRVRAIEESGQVIKRLFDPTARSRAGKTHTARPVATGLWTAIEFDHCGWRCPHCRGRGVTVNCFVKCGTCNGLVCGASLIQVHGSGRTFRCPCGAHADVIDGQIESFDGKMTDVTFHPRVIDARELPVHQDGGARELGQGGEPAAARAHRSLRHLLPRIFPKR